MLPFFGRFGSRRAKAALLNERAHMDRKCVGFSRTRVRIINPMIESESVNIISSSSRLLSFDLNASHVSCCCKIPCNICAQGLNFSHFNPVSLNRGRQSLISRGQGQSKGACAQYQSFIGSQCRRLSDRVYFLLFCALCQST